MKRKGQMILPFVCVLLTAAMCAAQTQQPEPTANVISGTVAAIGYPVGGDGTKVTIVGSAAAPQASGEAKVEANSGRNGCRVKGSRDATTNRVGRRVSHLCVVDGDARRNHYQPWRNPHRAERRGKADGKAQSQTFALIVTAEPYYAVRNS